MSIWKPIEKSAEAKKDLKLYDREELYPLIPKIKEYIEAYNASDECKMKIEHGILFGSFVKGADKCHDLDVAFIIELDDITATPYEIDMIRHAMQKDLHKISPCIELHFVDPDHCMKVNWAMLFSREERKKTDENQSYIFSGPVEFIYFRVPNSIKTQFYLPTPVFTGLFFATGICTWTTFGFLSCYSYRATLFCDENQRVNEVFVDGLYRIAGTNMNLFGFTDPFLKNEIKNGILHCLNNSLQT